MKPMAPSSRPSQRLGPANFRSAVLIVLLALLPVVSLAASLTDLKKQLDQSKRLQDVQQKRIQILNQELKNLDATTSARLAELRGLQNQIATLEQEKNTLSGQIKGLEAQTAETENKIAGLEANLADLKTRLAELLISLHREKAARYLPLLRAESFTDLAVRARWIGYLGQRQTNLVERIQATLVSLGEERVRLQLLVDALKEKRAEREQRIKVLSERRSQLQGALATLRREQVGRRVLLRETLQAQISLQAEIQKVQAAILAEQKRILEAERRAAAERRRRELAQKQSQQNIRATAEDLPKELGGRLQFPVSGGRIAEPFGRGGILSLLVQGPTENSPVVAAADGYVLYVLEYSNLGYTVLVQHTPRLVTSYANLQGLEVEVGQKVSRGQRLGFTGGGGLMGLNEMYFGVTVDSIFVDPSDYL